MTLGVVIPVFHAGERVNGVVCALRDFALKRGIACRVVLVEDAGGEAARVGEIAALEEGVTCVLLAQNVGQQMATYLGLSHVLDCDMVVTMDDDGQHPVELLDDLIANIRAGFDLCYAVPSRSGLSFFRKVGAAMRDGLFSACTQKPRGVKVSAYRVMTGKLARLLKPEPDGYIYLSAAAFQHRPRTNCIFYRARPEKKSSYTARRRIALYGGLLFHYTYLKVFCPGKKRSETYKTQVLSGRGYL